MISLSPPPQPKLYWVEETVDGERGRETGWSPRADEERCSSIKKFWRLV
jgi:hypothetical protein